MKHPSREIPCLSALIAITVLFYSLPALRFAYFFGTDAYYHMGFSEKFIQTRTLLWTHTYTNPPIYVFLMGLLSMATHIPLLYLYKFSSAVFIPLAAGCIYFLAKEVTAKRSVGFLASILFAFSSGMVGADWFTNFYIIFLEQRPEHLSFSFITLTFLLYLKSTKSKKGIYTVASGLFFGLTVLTSYLTGFIAGVILLFTLLFEKNYKSLMTIFGIGTLLSAIWVISHLDDILSMSTLMLRLRIFEVEYIDYFRNLGLPALLSFLLFVCMFLKKWTTIKMHPIVLIWWAVLTNISFSFIPLFPDLSARSIAQSKLPISIFAAIFLVSLHSGIQNLSSFHFKQSRFISIFLPFLFFVPCVIQPITSLTLYYPTDFRYGYNNDPPIRAIDWLNRQEEGVVAGTPTDMFFVYALTKQDVISFPGKLDPQQTHAMNVLHSNIPNGKVDVDLLTKYKIRYFLVDRMFTTLRDHQDLKLKSNLFFKIGFEDERTTILVFDHRLLIETQLLSSCENKSDWTASMMRDEIMIDMSLFREGTGSARLIYSDGVLGFHKFSYNLRSALDLSETKALGFWLYANASNTGLNFVIFDENGNWRLWFIYIDDTGWAFHVLPIGANDDQSAHIDLRTINTLAFEAIVHTTSDKTIQINVDQIVQK